MGRLAGDSIDSGRYTVLTLLMGLRPVGEENAIPKSLVEQILDEMFAIIEKREEFDSNAIQKLRQLASRGDLTKQKIVTEAIRLTSDGTS